ncbi:MAG TPA: hypothetical protein VLF68_01185 [Candidatus Saccharimonadales bacterium]|nr:hypothetical protein [Candidatus Saccharimonadales bacterium]
MSIREADIQAIVAGTRDHGEIKVPFNASEEQAILRDVAMPFLHPFLKRLETDPNLVEDGFSSVKDQYAKRLVDEREVIRELSGVRASAAYVIYEISQPLRIVDGLLEREENPMAVIWGEIGLGAWQCAGTLISAEDAIYLGSRDAAARQAALHNEKPNASRAKRFQKYAEILIQEQKAGVELPGLGVMQWHFTQGVAESNGFHPDGNIYFDSDIHRLPHANVVGQLLAMEVYKRVYPKFQPFPRPSV